MPHITAEHNNLVEVEVSVPQSELNKIFELAVKIDQIEIPYQSDPLKMANEAIMLMQGYASQIAALVRYRD